MNATIDTGKKRWSLSSKVRNGAFGLLLSFGALLPAAAWALDRMVPGQVAGWQQYPDGSLAVLLVGLPDLCPTLDSEWYKKRGLVQLGDGRFTADGMKAMLASFMEARISGRVINLFVRDQGAVCTVYAADF